MIGKEDKNKINFIYIYILFFKSKQISVIWRSRNHLNKEFGLQLN